ncbi:hypothetical protein KC19_2G131200 [Ceratodon purpureus]|uniref:POPLD domain-containing protein n=1 Tax=Ceratodon purpureus TaxID=3225 RepID=A0A8T0IX77_CERPU|nr:hypothetical protein KC19_2G131200 [Ceratodon purpureus]
MTKIWGHWLPEGLPGRGRGSRAVVRWAKEAAVLQDASFYSAIELEGSWDSISKALQLVLEPAPQSEAYNESSDLYSGAKYGEAIVSCHSLLYHLDRCPRGAIAPVTLISRPESKAGEERRVWLWVHAAAFEEAFACLQHLCQTQGLQCWSRKGQLGRLDLLGSKAASILKKVLHPVARQDTQEGCVEAISPSSCDTSTSISSLEDSRQFPGGAVIGMEVWDPRGRSHSNMTFQPSVLADAGSDGMEVEDMDIAVSNSGCPSTDNHADVKSSIIEPILQSNALERLQLASNREMWDRLDSMAHGNIVKPSSEKDLSTRRHKERLSYIQLNEVIENTNEELSAASESLKCPVLILKHASRRSSACGFSLILPIAWVRAFWVPLVFAGGHVIGLRERHWLYTDAQLSSFPHDYPECSSYDQHMARKAAEEQEAYSRKPPSKRGIWKSGLPDWNFENEAFPTYPENRSISQGVSRVESGAETSFDAICENSEEKTSNDTTVCPSSTGPDAPSAQFDYSTVHHVLTTESGAGISGVTEADVSMRDSGKPSNEALVPPSPCNLTAAEIIPRDAGDDCTSDPTIPAPMEVLHEGLTSDHTVGSREKHPPQTDCVSDSQPLASNTEGQNKERGSLTADMEASTSAQSARTLQEVSGHMEDPSTLKDESVRAAVGERKASEGGDNEKSSIFVARTRSTLQTVLRDCDLHHLPLLTGFRRSTESSDCPISPSLPILPRHPTWKLVGHGSTELAKKGCLVKVLIHAPRKGVFDSGAIIYLPLPSDVDSYFSSSQRWQGFDDPSFKQVQQSFLNKKKRKQKAKGEQKTTSALHDSTQPQSTVNPTDLPEPKSESYSLRVPIGIVTSGSVRGR